jgi:VanZ family protein
LKDFSLAHYIESFAWLFKVIFYLALATGCYLAFTPLEQSFQTKFNDKLLHFAGFLVMACCAQLAHPRVRYRFLASGLIVFGLAIEIVQAYLPYRSFSWWDWGADALAVVLYFMLIAPILKNKSLPD